jgi:hypothetical protein
MNWKDLILIHKEYWFGNRPFTQGVKFIELDTEVDSVRVVLGLNEIELWGEVEMNYDEVAMLRDWLNEALDNRPEK